MASRPLLSRRHLIVGSVAAALSAQQASSQGTPQANETATEVWQVIESDDLPRDAIARLAHVVVAPGEELPRYSVALQAVFLVVGSSVEASANSESFYAIRKGRRDPSLLSELSSGGGVMLGPRSSITIRNPTDSVAELLLLELVVPEDSATPGHAVNPVPDSAVRLLAEAPVTFAAHRGSLFVEQRVEDAGTSAVSSTWRGVELGEIARGSATLLPTRGSVTVTSAEGAGERTAEQGERLELTAGDRYVCADGSLVWRAGTGEPLVIRRGLVVPAPAPA